MMLRFLIAAAVALALSAAPARADYLHIGAEWGFPQGFSQQWVPEVQCHIVNPAYGDGDNCANIPPGKTLTAIYGTQTIKRAGIETLIYLVCGTTTDFIVVWTSEQITAGTLPVSVALHSDSHLQGGDGTRRCWVIWQAINGSSSTGPAAGLEVQLTLIAE